MPEIKPQRIVRLEVSMGLDVALEYRKDWYATRSWEGTLDGVTAVTLEADSIKLGQENKNIKAGDAILIEEEVMTATGPQVNSVVPVQRDPTQVVTHSADSKVAVLFWSNQFARLLPLLQRDALEVISRRNAANDSIVLNGALTGTILT